VYFIYHSDFSPQNLGKVSACREAALAKEAGYEYYYMGYYIPTCQKMRYKAAYHPQHVLDPATNEWVRFDGNVSKKMAEMEYFTLAETVEDEERMEDGGDDREDEDEDEDEARKAGFVFKTGMPGIMSRGELDKFEIGDMKVFGGEILAEAKVYMLPF
jgi:hypothetical protein